MLSAQRPSTGNDKPDWKFSSNKGPSREQNKPNSGGRRGPVKGKKKFGNRAEFLQVLDTFNSKE
jgi:hypothetical protein